MTFPKDFFRRIETESEVLIFADEITLTPDAIVPEKDLTVFSYRLTLSNKLINPGMEIKILARDIKVNDGTSIITSGVPGYSYNPQDIPAPKIVPGEHGTNGNPGSPGGHGGNIKVLAENIYGEELVVMANGGDGGNGQTGGSGAQGARGDAGQDAPIASGYNGGYPGHNGKPGGNAGKGGAGGIGGNGGNIKILYMNLNSSDITAVSTRGNGGTQGNHGAPGLGGERGEGGWNRKCVWQSDTPPGDWRRPAELNDGTLAVVSPSLNELVDNMLKVME